MQVKEPLDVWRKIEIDSVSKGDFVPIKVLCEFVELDFCNWILESLSCVWCEQSPSMCGLEGRSHQSGA